MTRSFTKGLIIGGVMGAAVSMMMEPDAMSRKSRKKMLKTGKNFMRKSGNVIGDVVDLFR